MSNPKSNGEMHHTQRTKTKRSVQHPWYYSCLLLFPRGRVHVSSSTLTNIITGLIFSIALVITMFILQSLFQTEPPPQVKLYIPMIQFNRGDVNKAEVIQNARRALEKMNTFQNSVDENINDPKRIMEAVIETMDKKEKRQFLALEAFDMFDTARFESTMKLGYETNTPANNTMSDVYRSYSKKIKHTRPDYDKLCYNTSFTISNTNRPVDDSFCSRLKVLETEIREGREPPLLTVYTWWPDPISDPEVLSKRAVMANWDLFRPFIMPVVFTNYRMNMAVANAHGWPCLPVRRENKDQLPVFKDTALDMNATFNSTFFGYAMANSMFDSSLLQTLLSIKNRFVVKQPLNLNMSKKGNDSLKQGLDSLLPEMPILIYGRPINLPALGTETFNKFENFHNVVKHTVRKNASRAISMKSNYIIHRGIDFSDYHSLVIDDDYLIPYIVQRCTQSKSIVIDTSESVLSAKTHRHRDINEWGRHFIKLKPRDVLYNRRLVEKFERCATKAKCYKTLYDDTNRIQVVSIDEPYVGMFPRSVVNAVVNL